MKKKTSRMKNRKSTGLKHAPIGTPKTVGEKLSHLDASFSFNRGQAEM